MTSSKFLAWKVMKHLCSSPSNLIPNPLRSLQIKSPYMLLQKVRATGIPRPLYNRKAFPWTPQQATPKPTQKVGIWWQGDEQYNFESYSQYLIRMGASLFQHKLLQTSKMWIISFFLNIMFGSTCQSLDFFSSFGAVRKEPSFFCSVSKYRQPWRARHSRIRKIGISFVWRALERLTLLDNKIKVKIRLPAYAATRADKISCWCPHQHSQQFVTADFVSAILGWECTSFYNLQH